MFAKAVIVFISAAVATAGPVERRAYEHSGTGTVYGGGGQGWCGTEVNGNGLEVALGPSYMEAGACGKTITVKNTGSDTNNAHGTGTVKTFTVTNECPECGTEDIDMTTGAWNAITNNGAQGTITVEWSMN